MRSLTKLALVAVMLAVAAGCAGTNNGEPSARRHVLEAFLAQPQRFVVFAPVVLQMDEQARILGLAHRGDEVVNRFDPVRPMNGIAERIIAGSPLLADGRTMIAAGREAGRLRIGPAEPVLFLHATWKLVYRRLPPDLWRYRLQVGIVAKVIPLGQVLSGKGPSNLGTDAWQDGCAVDAFDGAFLHLSEWERDHARRLDEAIAEVQATCGARLGARLGASLAQALHGRDRGESPARIPSAWRAGRITSVADQGRT